MTHAGEEVSNEVAAYVQQQLGHAVQTIVQNVMKQGYDQKAALVHMTMELISLASSTLHILEATHERQEVLFKIGRLLGETRFLMASDKLTKAEADALLIEQCAEIKETYEAAYGSD